MWYSGAAQRGQIDPLQLSLKRKSAIGQLPFLHHRAQRGSDNGARREAQ